MSVVIVDPFDPSKAFAVYLEEFKALKSEQTSRIRERDSYLWVAGGALLTVAAAAFQFHQPWILLAVPVICLVIGWVQLANDQKVTAAADYARNHLAPRLAAITGDPHILGWETWKNVDGRDRERRLLWLAVNLLLFVAPSIAAAVVLYAHVVGQLIPAVIHQHPGDVVALLASMLGVYAVLVSPAVMVRQILLYRGPAGRQGTP
jgi:hypothetical protein